MEEPDLLELGAPPEEEDEEKKPNDIEAIDIERDNLPTGLDEPPSVLEGAHVNRDLIKVELDIKSAEKNTLMTGEAKRFAYQKAEDFLTSCDSSETYSVDFRHFPIYFQTDEEALQTYNSLGLIKKLQFKKCGARRDENGFINQFTIACHMRNTKKYRYDTKLVLRDGISAMLCPVIARFKWVESKQCYMRDGKCCIKHSHPPEIRDRYLLQNPEVKSEIAMYVECKITAADVQKIINEKYNCNVKYGEVYNLMKNIKYGNYKFMASASDVEKFVNMIKEYKVGDPEMSYEIEYDEEDKTRLNKAIFITGKMKKVYQKFRDVVIVDAIYKTNKHDMPLVVFSGVTCEGNNIIFAYAFIKKEDIESYQWVMKKFVFYNDSLEPGVVLTDFDSALCHGIERSMNKSVHLLCQFSIQQLFRRQFIHLSKRKSASANMLYRHIIETISTNSSQRFLELQDIIFSSDDHLSEEKLEYLRSMFAIKEKWSNAYIPNVFTANTRCITRALSINAQLKQRIFARSTLCDVFTLGLDLFDKILRKIIREMYVARRDVRHSHPILTYLGNIYSNHSFNLMLIEYALSFYHTVSRPESQAKTFCGSYIVKDNASEEKDQYMVQIREFQTNERDGFTSLFDITCRCKDFNHNLIYCDHIFAVINCLQIKNFSQFKHIERWVKSEVILKDILTVNQRHLQDITNNRKAKIDPEVQSLMKVPVPVKQEHYYNFQ
ncbi:unnamed protein product [Moneuplotes crassus]|uniref:SWIM-type domain-containing protein n=1 Tax=Euplotes crassus TaxID=5936 RepID=A0AAD1X5P2_EUPCR|nr:unnamed protein product [Moneuplotes crassus]